MTNENERAGRSPRVYEKMVQSSPPHPSHVPSSFSGVSCTGHRRRSSIFRIVSPVWESTIQSETLSVTSRYLQQPPLRIAELLVRTPVCLEAEQAESVA